MIQVLRQCEQWLRINAELDARHLLYTAFGWTMGKLHDGPIPQPVAWPDIARLTVRELLGRHTMLAPADAEQPQALTFDEALAIYTRIAFETFSERLAAAIQMMDSADEDATVAEARAALLAAAGNAPAVPGTVADFWVRLVRYLLREEMEMSVLDAIQFETSADGFYRLGDARASSLLAQTLTRFAPADDRRIFIGGNRVAGGLTQRWFVYPQAVPHGTPVQAWLLGMELSDDYTILGYAVARAIRSGPLTAANYVGAADTLDVEATLAAHAAIEALGGDTPAGTTLYLLDWELQPHLRGHGMGFELVRDLFTLARKRLRRIDQVAVFLQPAQYLFPLPERAPAQLHELALDAMEKLHAAWQTHQPQRHAGAKTRALLLRQNLARGGLWGHVALLARYAGVVGGSDAASTRQPHG